MKKSRAVRVPKADLQRALKPEVWEANRDIFDPTHPAFERSADWDATKVCVLERCDIAPEYLAAIAAARGTK